MAVHSIVIPPDPGRDARAAQLVDSVGGWPRVTLRQSWGSFAVGDQFRVTPNGYRVNAVVCECRDYERGHVCKHIRAVVAFEARIAAEDAELDAILGPQPRSRYDQLFPGCRDCGDPVDGYHDGYCYQCGSDREWEARRDR